MLSEKNSSSQNKNILPQDKKGGVDSPFYKELLRVIEKSELKAKRNLFYSLISDFELEKEAKNAALEKRWDDFCTIYETVLNLGKKFDEEVELYLEQGFKEVKESDDSFLLVPLLELTNKKGKASYNHFNEALSIFEKRKEWDSYALTIDLMRKARLTLPERHEEKLLEGLNYFAEEGFLESFLLIIDTIEKVNPELIKNAEVKLKELFNNYAAKGNWNKCIVLAEKIKELNMSLPQNFKEILKKALEEAYYNKSWHLYAHILLVLEEKGEKVLKEASAKLKESLEEYEKKEELGKYVALLQSVIKLGFLNEKEIARSLKKMALKKQWNSYHITYQTVQDLKINIPEELKDDLYQGLKDAFAIKDWSLFIFYLEELHKLNKKLPLNIDQAIFKALEDCYFRKEWHNYSLLFKTAKELNIIDFEHPLYLEVLNFVNNLSFEEKTKVHSDILDICITQDREMYEFLVSHVEQNITHGYTFLHLHPKFKEIFMHIKNELLANKDYLFNLSKKSILRGFYRKNEEVEEIIDKEILPFQREEKIYQALFDRTFVPLGLKFHTKEEKGVLDNYFVRTGGFVAHKYKQCYVIPPFPNTYSLEFFMLTVEKLLERKERPLYKDMYVQVCFPERIPNELCGILTLAFLYAKKDILVFTEEILEHNQEQIGITIYDAGNFESGIHTTFNKENKPIPLQISGRTDLLFCNSWDDINLAATIYTLIFHAFYKKDKLIYKEIGEKFIEEFKILLKEYNKENYLEAKFIELKKEDIPQLSSILLQITEERNKLNELVKKYNQAKRYLEKEKDHQVIKIVESQMKGDLYKIKNSFTFRLRDLIEKYHKYLLEHSVEEGKGDF
jgi:hypothetical protein